LKDTEGIGLIKFSAGIDFWTVSVNEEYHSRISGRSNI